jgi:stage IV sporulation protein B
MKGINIEGDRVSVADNLFRNFAKIKSNDIGEDKLTLSVFGGVIKKDINVNVLPNSEVILGGDTVGIRLYSEGVLVIGMMPVQAKNGEYYEPYKTTKIEKGDIIKKINNVPIETIEELVKELNKPNKNNEVLIEYEKDGVKIKENIVVVDAFDDGKKKIGLWVKDGVMGVGTLTFYNPKTGTYAALGHGISEQEVKELIQVDTGAINVASILNVKKGEKNSPGEIRGLLNDNLQLGTINKNETSGIYGDINDLSNYFRGRETIEIANKNEIELRKSPNNMYSRRG